MRCDDAGVPVPWPSDARRDERGSVCSLPDDTRRDDPGVSCSPVRTMREVMTPRPGATSRAHYLCRSALAVCAIAIAFSNRPVAADILIESHRAARPVDTDRVLAPIRAELVGAGVAVQPADVIAGAGAQLPLSG